MPGYQARVERGVPISVKAFDWNCSEHITPRFTQAELVEVLAPIRQEMTALRVENDGLRRQLDADGRERTSS